ncbi:MAG: hypothetical protein U1F09_10170 [Steroidobacteraceae bacterium]
MFSRLRASAGTRDWLAVGIDFAVVVIGVFLGIQAANWNNARLDRQREHRALELLIEEAQNNIAYARLILYRADLMQKDRIAAAAMLESRAATGGDPVRGLAAMAVFRDMTPIHAAYDELTWSGDINLIQSHEVRNALALYNGVVVFHDRMRSEYVDRAPDIMALASSYMKVRFDSSSPIGYTAIVDWTAAGRDSLLVNSVNRVMGAQHEFNERRRIILDHAEKLCAALANELKKKCQAPDWVAEERREAGPG